MFVVALMELRTSIEEESAAIAAQLGTTMYEERLRLNAGLPAVVLRTVDKKAATDLLSAIRARGNTAVACDTSKVVPSESMILMRNFTLGAEAAAVPARPTEPLRYDDILALIRATHKTRTDTRSDVTAKKLSVGRALMTGGVMMTKNVKSEERSTSTDREQVLYIFRSSGETPWILRERATSYAALGASAGPSSFQNFMATIAKLRASAPSAVYDDRLTAPGVASGGLALTVKTSSVGSKDSVTTATASGVDVLAHLIALWIAKAGRAGSQ